MKCIEPNPVWTQRPAHVKCVGMACHTAADGEKGHAFLVDGKTCCVICAYHYLTENLLEAGCAATMKDAVVWLEEYYGGKIFPEGINADGSEKYMVFLLESLGKTHPHLVTCCTQQVN